MPRWGDGQNMWRCRFRYRRSYGPAKLPSCWNVFITINTFSEAVANSIEQDDRVREESESQRRVSEEVILLSSRGWWQPPSDMALPQSTLRFIPWLGYAQGSRRCTLSRECATVVNDPSLFTINGRSLSHTGIYIATVISRCDTQRHGDTHWLQSLWTRWYRRSYTPKTSPK